MSITSCDAIYKSLRSLPAAAEVIIESNSGVLQVIPDTLGKRGPAAETIKKYMKKLFSCCVYTKAHPGTTAFLEAHFGSYRLSSLCRRVGINLGNIITRLEVQKLFVQSAEVYYTDLKDFIYFLKNEPSQLPASSKTFELLTKLKYVNSVDDCDTSTIRKIMDTLVPFKNVEDLFLGEVPSTITAVDSGKTFRGVKERVSVYQSLRDPTCTKRSWIMHLAKQLTDLEMPKGVVIANCRGGFHFVYDIVHKGGAYKYFLKPVGKNPIDSNRYVLYRGTRALLSATGGIDSVFDDLRPDIGSKGAIATFDKTHELLTNAEMGFVGDSARVVGISMSLGGTHSARDALLHPFNKIITVASPGIDKATCELFAQRISKMSITHYIEGGDLIHHFGEAKLGFGCNPLDVKVKVHILVPGKKAELPIDALSPYPKLPDRYISFLSTTAKSLIHALTYIHNRMTLTDLHTIFTYSNQSNKEDIEAILSHEVLDKRLEVARRKISLLFGRETFYTFAAKKLNGV